MKRAAGLFYFLIATTCFADDLYLQVESAKIKSQPKMWASSVGEVRYGQRVVAITEKNAPPDGWLKVKSGAGAGYLHVSALTNKKVVFKGTSRAGDSPFADPSEVVLAGKGFSKEVEKEYARSGKGNFGRVNEVERQRVSSGELAAFVQAGNLGGK